MIDRDQPARKLQGLERRIQQWADSQDETAGRLRRRIGVIALAAMLEASTAADGNPHFLFKGGSALELRFGKQARVSRDVDLAYRGSIDEVIDQLRAAARGGWGHFTARVKDPEALTIPWANADGLRVEVALAYAGRPYTTLVLEVVASPIDDIDRVATFSLAPVGLTPPDTIPCLSLRYQVAEKLHACSDPLDGDIQNDRVGDVMDLILIEDLTDIDADTHLGPVREACEEVFGHRDRHPWPPAIAVAEGWPSTWDAIVHENGFYVTMIDEAVERVNALIARIDAAVI